MPSITTWIRQCDEHWFALMFSGYPQLTVHNARKHPVDLEQMDALLLTGGGDISPRFLRQPIAQPSLIVDTDCARDEWEFKAAGELLSSGKPILAICRGLQVLNVALVGTLHIDIPGHDSAERENIQPLRHCSSAIHRFAAVNSSHHRALEKLADGIEVEAWSASDGIVEQARLRSHPYAIGAISSRAGSALSSVVRRFLRSSSQRRIRCLRFALVAVSILNANRRPQSYCW
ncbi:MAG TPA: gamma-glutamyl-gamma-aminobutyrate hydrolase family protein [Candidatus Binatus sp.]|uniref:gamma-glutamyl-gamma-aminobutyrate hydrolase family protein n=1 Tax=Candidatus Binatus sp. TaxID=2811406 RepID=UPI002B495BD3|nr:gamma-glutamyl-gamma-aminobutyrate hydrolase family protein [Candidatus Binatus sp.]HKN12071.1 gamma-glutamyl-gamma-aminobutyrate hydrolase family protein [Candidatus Binatus sp.]